MPRTESGKRLAWAVGVAYRIALIDAAEDEAIRDYLVSPEFRDALARALFDEFYSTGDETNYRDHADAIIAALEEQG